MTKEYFQQEHEASLLVLAKVGSTLIVLKQVERETVEGIRA